MRSLLIPGLILACLTIGCEKNQQSPPKATPAASTMPAESANAPAATPVTPAAPAPAVEKSATTNPTAANSATTNPAVADARQKLQQVTQYVRQHKYDLAQKLLNELDANKASLPASIQTRITQAQAMLNAAKGASSAGNAAGSIKLPGSK